MASSSSNPNHNNNKNTCSVNVGLDPNSETNTTFVQADPSNFRAVVQKLTGASPEPSAHKLPVTVPSRVTTSKSGEMGPRRPAFKLQERRQSGRKLEIKLNNNKNGGLVCGGYSCLSPRHRMMMINSNHNMIMASPVSPLDHVMLTRGSPRTPMSPLEEEEEERAIAQKGFYLHPSPLTTPRGSEPQLLPLFPLHSPHATTNS